MVHTYRISRSQLNGSIRVPPSKSQTQRALLFGFLAKGESAIENFLLSPDIEAMIAACRAFGAKVSIVDKTLFITGVDGKISCPQDVIHVGNSGQVLRFMGAVAALSSFPCVFTGDVSIRTSRPAEPLLDAIRQLGGKAFSLRQNGYAPFFIQGPIQSAAAVMTGEDSQPVSGLLMAGSFAKGPIELFVTNPGEKPWIELTLSWLKRFGLPFKRTGYEYYRLEGDGRIDGFSYNVPGDFSSCAFPLAAALLTGSELVLQNLDMDDPQGDKHLLSLLQQMGASIAVDRENRRWIVGKSAEVRGCEVDVNPFIDALPILAVIGCFAKSPTTLFGAGIARKKESDRLSIITQELQKMGANIDEGEDYLTIYPALLKGARVKAYEDHRIAMALAVAGLAADGETLLEGAACVSKSYPGFFDEMKRVGGSIECL